MSILNQRDNVKHTQWEEIKKTERHHNHNLAMREDGVLCWEKTITDYGDINKKWEEWAKKGLNKNSEEIREYYRGIGYSIYGYWEIFYWEVNNPEANEYDPYKRIGVDE